MFEISWTVGHAFQHTDTAMALVLKIRIQKWNNEIISVIIIVEKRNDFCANNKTFNYKVL